ncbi:hypothetical protein LCGC14_0377700 [marine sediment metagenome]|uniref:Uncharacterized protein n=1 Tax=marine sediment metagenome TaxID=412755 RepID=A0A0F9WBU1_9ZZZZ
MADEVEKVGVDNGDGGGANQPDIQDVTHDGAEQDTTHDGAEQGGASTNSNAESTGGAEANSDATGDARKKKDNGKIKFPIADALYRNKDGDVVTAAVKVDDAIKLVAVPKPVFDGDKVNEHGNRIVLYTGWNHRKHDPLKKDDFVDEVDYVLYQAFTFRIRAAVLIEKATTSEKRARHLKKFGNDKQRKEANRLLKMRETLRLYEKTLRDQGIDIDGLDDAD